MKPTGLSILLYDDDPDIRAQLKLVLETQGLGESCPISITAPDSPSEAIDTVRQNPDGFHFIMIDHVIKDIEEGDVTEHTGPDGHVRTGLHLCHKISRINPNIPIILYTTERARAPENYEAVAMGASRVVMQKELPGLVSQLQKELRDLSDISARLEEIHASRRGFSNVLAGLAVGFQVVDRYGRIWFRDEVFRRLTGDSGLPYEICYCKCHGYDIRHGICPNCLVREVIRKGREDAAMYYSPTYPGGAGSEPDFQYLSVQVSPVYSKEASQGSSPIAAVEAVSRVPYRRIADLHLITHLEMLVRGLEDMGFRRIRIYRANRSGTSKHGLVYRGPIGENVDFTAVDIPLQLQPVLDEHEVGSLAKVVQEHDYVEMDPELAQKLAFQAGHVPVCVALFDASGDFIGWVALDNGIYPISDKRTLPVVQDGDLMPEPINGHIRPAPMKLIEEIARVIAAKPLTHLKAGDGAEVATAERCFERIRMRIAAETTRSSVRVVERIVAAVRKEVEGLDMAHVRAIEDDRRAVLVAAVGDYGAAAYNEIDVRTSKRVTARVARTGVPEYVGTREELGNTTGMDELGAEQLKILMNHASHAAYPLHDEGRVVGTASFQSKQEHFFEGYHRHLFQFVADLLARALHDQMSLDHERKQVAAEIGQRAAALVIHNVSGPLGSIRNCVQLAFEDLSKDPAAVAEYLRRIDGYCKRIASIRSDFLKLFKGVDEEPRAVDFQELISRVVGTAVDGSGVETRLQLDQSIGTVITRGGVLEACLEVLVRNAVDALDESERGGALHVVLRTPDTADSREKDFAYAGIAIDVIDNGIGIESSAKGRLFEEFYSSKRGGLGIGLASARQTARASGGDIYYADDDVRGTRFTLVFRVVAIDMLRGKEE